MTKERSTKHDGDETDSVPIEWLRSLEERASAQAKKEATFPLFVGMGLLPLIELADEWQKRTLWGRLKLVLWSPLPLVGGLAVLPFIILGVLILYCSIAWQWIGERTPETYREEL